MLHARSRNAIDDGTHVDFHSQHVDFSILLLYCYSVLQFER